MQTGSAHADDPFVGPDRDSRRRRPATRVRTVLSRILAGALMIGAVTLAGPAVARADTSSDEVAAAQSSARAAAQRVDALRIQYLHLSERAAATAGRLSAAFAEQSRISGRHDADAAARAQAAATRLASVRAVYAAGGTLGLLGSVLSASSPDEALWRIGTARRIEANTLLADLRDADEAEAAESRSLQQQDQADRADAELAAALAAVQNDVAAADLALARAQSELDRLTATARRLTAAREAALRLAQARAAAQASRLAAADVSALVIPPAYLATYQAAATTCPGMDWTLLAAVGQIESGHGRNNGPSSAGAIGPMQFMPATFAQYAVDGNHDGVTDAWDYRDAIFSAAAYLCASGARGGTSDGVRTALFAYNHAQWYVDLVLSARAAIAAGAPG